MSSQKGEEITLTNYNLCIKIRMFSPLFVCSRQELYDMASVPKEEHSYILDSFEEFEALARRALHEGRTPCLVDSYILFSYLSFFVFNLRFYFSFFSLHVFLLIFFIFFPYFCIR